MTARISSPGESPDFADGVPGQRLQHDDASGQHRDHAAEALLRRGLHLLELLELAGVEEDGVRIEPAQQAGDRALVEGCSEETGSAAFCSTAA